MRDRHFVMQALDVGVGRRGGRGGVRMIFGIWWDMVWARGDPGRLRMEAGWTALSFPAYDGG